MHCRSPRTNRCVAIRDQQGVGHLPDGTTRFSRNGAPLRHFMGTSTFAECTVMPEIALAKVSPEAPLDGCAPFACGLSTGIGAALYTARVAEGSTCVVFGCGLVGLGAVIGCRLAGAGRIVAIDLSEGRLAEARRHGATDVRIAGEDTVEWIRAETGGFGADYTFEATGSVRVMQQAVDAAREAWGLATMIGVAGKGETLDIVPRLLITGRRVTGSSFGGVKGRTQVPQLVDRWLAGEIDAGALVTRRIALDEVNDAFAAMERQERHPHRYHVLTDSQGHHLLTPAASHRLRTDGRGAWMIPLMMAQPTGTVTLVFTDIEGSTRLLDELGRDAYRRRSREHRRVVREAFGRHDGYEVDNEGDALLLRVRDGAGSASRAVAQAMARARTAARSGSGSASTPASRRSTRRSTSASTSTARHGS